MNIFSKLKFTVTLIRATKMADEEHKENGDTYYVVPMIDKRLMVINRRDFKILKRKNYIPKQATLSDLKRECFYATDIPESKVKEKKKQFMKWITSE